MLFGHTKMIKTSLQYLARDDLYRTEKPYSADFEVDTINGARKSNLIFEKQDTQVMPVEGRGGFSIDTNGFCILKEKTSLQAKDALDRPANVEMIYQAELETILHKHFPEFRRFESLDFVVSNFVVYSYLKLILPPGQAARPSLSFQAARSAET